MRTRIRSVPHIVLGGSKSFPMPVCELRHITLPRIDLHCGALLPRLIPAANGGFLLRNAVRGPRGWCDPALWAIIREAPVLMVSAEGLEPSTP